MCVAGYRTVPCDLCEKVFIKRVEYVRHMETEHGLRPAESDPKVQSVSSVRMRVFDVPLCRARAFKLFGTIDLGCTCIDALTRNMMTVRIRALTPLMPGDIFAKLLLGVQFLLSKLKVFPGQVEFTTSILLQFMPQLQRVESSGVATYQIVQTSALPGSPSGRAVSLLGGGNHPPGTVTLLTGSGHHRGETVTSATTGDTVTLATVGEDGVVTLATDDQEMAGTVTMVEETEVEGESTGTVMLLSTDESGRMTLIGTDDDNAEEVTLTEGEYETVQIVNAEEEEGAGGVEGDNTGATGQAYIVMVNQREVEYAVQS